MSASDCGAGMGFVLSSSNNPQEDRPAPKSPPISEAEREPLVARDEFRRAVLGSAQQFVEDVFAHQTVYHDAHAKEDMLDNIGKALERYRTSR